MPLIEREETPALSWEIPRNVKEIRRVISSAILKQWAIPMIDFADNAASYDHDEKNSSFVVRNYKKNYLITIKEME